MKKKFVIVLCVVLILTLAASATLFLDRMWGDPALFYAHIEQPVQGETKLVLSANGKQLEPGEDLAVSGSGVIIPMMNGHVTYTDGRWADKDGKVAFEAPTITLSTSNGDEMEDIYYRVEVHFGANATGQPYGQVPEEHCQEIRAALNFGIQETIDSTGSTATELTPLSDVGGFLATDWACLGNLPAGESIDLTLSAWAESVAPADPFCVRLVIATGGEE